MARVGSIERGEYKVRYYYLKITKILSYGCNNITAEALRHRVLDGTLCVSAPRRLKILNVRVENDLILLKK